MTKSHILRIIRLIVTVGIIAFLIYRVDRGEVVRHLKGIAVLPLCLAAVMDFAMILTNSIRWRVLLRAKGIRSSQVKLVYYYLVGNFFSAFLPTAVGGDVVRIVGMSAEADRRADIFASVLVERLLGFFVLLPIGLCALPLIGREQVEWRQVATVWVVVGLMFLAAYIVLLRPVARRLSRVLDPLLGLFHKFKARERLERAYEAVVSYSCCRPALYKGFTLSVLSRLLWISGCFLVARAFSIELSYTSLLVVVPVVELARMIPISFAGIGIREATFAAMLKPFGVAESLGLAYSAVVYLVFMLFALIGGLLYGTRQFLRKS